MNTNNVVSAPAVGDLTGKESYVVTLKSGGVDLCGASDTVIGTLYRAMPHQESGVFAGKAVAVQLAPGSIHYATIGNDSSTVSVGDTLALDTAPENKGKLVKSSSNPVAKAWMAFTAADGLIVEVIFL